MVSPGNGNVPGAIQLVDQDSVTARSSEALDANFGGPEGAVTTYDLSYGYVDVRGVIDVPSTK